MTVRIDAFRARRLDERRAVAVDRMIDVRTPPMRSRAGVNITAFGGLCLR
jgi:hypothetical protein